jgi:hypothetical protein
MLVDLRLRFDEAFVAESDLPALMSNDQLNAAPRTTQNLRATELPAFFDVSSLDRLSYAQGIVPREASIEFPGYRDAGKFSLTLSYQDLPIDPRTLRAAGVVVYMNTVAAADFAEGMILRRAQFGELLRSQLTPSTSVISMIGVIDEWRVDHDDKSSTVKISGRDLRALLLDSPLTPKTITALDLTQNIVDVVRQILARHPFGSRILVEADATEWPNGTFPTIGTTEALTQVRQSNPRGQRGRRMMQAPQGNSTQVKFWDLIVRMCFLTGSVPYFQGQVLRIRPLRGLYDQDRRRGGPGIPTPFAGGRPRLLPGTPNGSGEELFVRRMAYGRNIASLSFHRKFGGQAAQVVEVVSVDTDSTSRGLDRILRVKHPPEAEQQQTPPRVNTRARRSRVAPSGQQSEENVARVVVSGVRDLTKLREVARAIFEEIVRGEMGGSVETRDLASLGGDNADPDLLRLRPGDAIEIVTETRPLSTTAPQVGELTDHARRSLEQEIQAIADRGITPGLARVIAITNRGGAAQLPRFFYVTNVKFSWRGNGYGVEFDFINYVEASRGVTPPVNTQPAARAPRRTPSP